MPLGLTGKRRETVYYSYKRRYIVFCKGAVFGQPPFCFAEKERVEQRKNVLLILTFIFIYGRSVSNRTEWRNAMSWLSQTADAEPALDVASPVSRAVHGIWEADELFKCPLVGMGITLAEQKHLLKKMSLPAIELTPFEMHELFVNAAATENPLSRKMSQLLRRKYEREAVPLRLLSEEEFLAQWKKAFSIGSYVGFLWAAATRELSDEARRTVYGAVHMAMHSVAEEQTRTRRFIAELERKNEQQANRIRLLKEREAVSRSGMEQAEEGRRALAQENAALRDERNRLKAELDAMYEASTALWEIRGPELEAENENLREALASLTQRFESQRELVNSLLKQGRARFEQGTGAAADSCGTCCGRDCDESCPSFDLCSKRVLIVGGVERMESLYREFIEGGGGVLDYHNGSLQGGTRQLERSLRRADIILCPVNCNSHGACIKVKNLAKKHNKTFYMLPNGSLSTISRLLGNEAARQEGERA